MEHQGNGGGTIPLAVMQSANETHNVHIIDIQRTDNVSASSNHQEHRASRGLDDDDASQGDLDPPNNQNHVASLSRSNSIQQLRSPLNSRVWILVELCIVFVQITTLIVALLLSRHEKVGITLFVWVVGYAFGCIAAIPVLCWHYYNISKYIEQNANWDNPNVSSSTHPIEDGDLNVSSTTIPDEDQHRMVSTSSSIQDDGSSSLRISRNMSAALDVFFAVWFIYGNVCLLGGYASPVDSPNIHQLCMIFIILSYIGYSMPFILCALICCFLPCIVTAIESEDQYQTRGASDESINALPTFKFKLKGNNDDQDFNLEKKEENVLASQNDEDEDLACCVCLAEFEDDDEMRKLPCSHFFHMECIDKWLKINATCPLCKFEIGLSPGASPPPSNSNHHNS